MILLLPLLACKGVDPAPADLDGLLHWYWSQYEVGEDEALLEGITNALALVDVQAVYDQAQDGSISRLSVEEAALVGVTDRDPALAVGLYLINAFDCTMEELEPVLWEPDQASLYEGVYESYERTFTSSQEDFASGTTDVVTWEVVYTVDGVGTYVAETVGGLRRLPEGALLQRTYLPEPADYDSDGKSFDQDYQIEAYIEQPEGVMLHLYGIWRQADYGTLGTTESDVVQRFLLNELDKWDDETEAACGS